MSALAGQWHDGRSSRARAVTLRLAAPGMLAIVARDGDEALWPLAEVVASPRLGDTPRLLRRAGHGQVECADSPLLDEWFPRPASRIEAWADRLERRRGAIAAAAVLAVAFVWGFFSVGVPWLALHAAARMPPAVERQASRQVLALLERTWFEETALPGSRRRSLERRFLAMVDGEPRYAQMRLHFVAAPGLGPNALALPDGSIFVTDALVELAGDDDEILAVLAHEAGHHVHRHGMRQAIESSSVLLMVGFALGDVSGSSLAVALPAVLLENGFSRGHEREADAYAFGLLRRRGLPVQAFARIMQRLSGPHAGRGEGPAGYLSTHPPTPERIRAAERAAAVPGPGEAESR